MKDLKQKTVSALGWNGAAQVVRQGLQFAVGVMLARILSPDDFGLMGMILVFSGFVNLLADMGLGIAVIQKKDVTPEQLNAVFWANMIVGIALAALLAALAPALARFYGRPELGALTMVAAIESVLAPFKMIQNSLLEKAMKFRQLSIIEMTSVVVSGIAAIVMAISGLGVWSLVIRSLIAVSVTAVMMWVMSAWRPTFDFRVRSLSDFSKFGLNLLGFYSLNYWVRNSDNLLVGKYLGGAELGIYARGYYLMLLPITQITRVLGRVMLPALSAIQDDKERIRRIYLRAIRALGLVAFPMMAGLLVVAEPFVLAVYGEKWRGLIPVLRVLCLIGIPQSVGGTVGWIYLSQGRTDLMFRWGVYVTCITIPSYVVGLKWGAVGVASCYAVAVYVLLMIPSWWVSGRLINVSLGDIGRSLKGPLLCAVGMGAIVWVTDVLLPVTWPQALKLAVEVIIGVAVYVVLVYATKQEGAKDMLGMLRSRKRAVLVEGADSVDGRDAMA